MNRITRYATSVVIATAVVAAGFGVLAPRAQALTVSPVRLELTADPGKTIGGTIELYNDEGAAKTFYSSFENFEALGETGTPHFTPGTTGLASWIQAPSQVTLKAKEDKKLDFSITVPKDADPGGHFAAIFWSQNQPSATGAGQVAVSAKIGILVLLNVTGAVNEAAGLLEFKATGGQKFFSSLPVGFYYRFNNKGGDRVQPVGDVKITNTFGQTAATIDANPSKGNVLPNSVRRFEVSWVGKHPELTNSGFFGAVKYEWKNFAFGWYTAHLSLTYGTQGEATTASFSLFVIPWQLLSVVLVILLILMVLGRWGLKRYNQWVISKARAAGGA